MKRLSHMTARTLGWPAGRRCGVRSKPKGVKPDLLDAKELAVEVDLSDLAGGLELDEDLFAGGGGGEGEGLPRPGAAAPLDLLATVAGRGPVVEGIGVVVGVRGGNGGPSGVVEGGRRGAGGISFEECANRD